MLPPYQAVPNPTMMDAGPYSYPSRFHKGQEIRYMSKQAKPLPSRLASESTDNRYQKFSKVRRTNYVRYTPPATIAHRSGDPAYRAVLANETARQRQNEGLSPVWPRPGAPPVHAGVYYHTSPSARHGFESNPLVSVLQPSANMGETQNRICQIEHGDDVGHRRLPRGSTAKLCGRSVSYEGERTRSETRGRYPSKNRDAVAYTTSQSRSSRSPQFSKHQARGAILCPVCHGTGNIRGTDGETQRCCDCKLGKILCCNDSSSRERGSVNLHRRNDLDSNFYVDRPQAVGLGYFTDEESVHKYIPSEKKEEERDLGYNIRKHFFDASKMKVTDQGSRRKLLPQYSVSYKNYPAVCYDVVVPMSNKDFYRARKAPGFFAIA